MDYKKNFLKSVVFRINFNVIEALKKEISNDVTEICESISQSKVNQQIGLTINFQTIGIQQIAQQRTFTWVFNGAKIRIQIQNDFLIITALEYSKHADFHQNIIEIFNVFSKRYNPFINTISLRYINNIYFREGSTFEFSNYIHPSLLGATIEFSKFPLTRSVGVLSLRDDNNVVVNFAYGFLNSEFPNKIAKREFVLDFDCSLNLNTNADTIQKELKLLRNKANELFENSILEGLRQEMQPIQN